MRTIKKGSEPQALNTWKRLHPQRSYSELNSDVRQAIRQQALDEQFYLCAYCCQRISTIKDGHNEHLEAQRLNPQRTLDFTNIVVSCNTLNQCGKAHQSQALPLTPLMAACETELRFKISGRVEGVSDRACETIRILNLGDDEKNNRALIEKRKQLSNALLWANSIDPHEGLEDEALLMLLMADLAQPQGGQLEAFAPVVISIVRGWLQSLGC
ncbi:hypothetical protein [Spirulina major]|uniref:hypothetical protein n=1 Tax=Spirulina major TaxID=270636 RepID=UPI000934E26A|nr:hypothetical protein [Spirulina major]